MTDLLRFRKPAWKIVFGNRLSANEVAGSGRISILSVLRLKKSVTAFFSRLTRGQDVRSISYLAFADLRFEWILSLCMMVALGAIFAPLFILQGLQSGIVGNMLDALQKDPGSRMVSPKFHVGAPLDEIWLEQLRQRSDVLITAPTAYLLLQAEGLEDRVNILPTTPDDPLLVEHGIRLQEERAELVLSKRAAMLTQKAVGDHCKLILTRNTGVEERIPVGFRVAGILPGRVADEVKIWLPSKYFEGIHDWRGGRAFPALGLRGKGAILTPEYDGILALSERIPGRREYQRMLARRFSFSRAPVAVEALGWQPVGNKQIRLWQPINNTVRATESRELRSRYAEMGYAVETLPFVDNLRLRLGSNGPTLRATILPEDLRSGGAVPGGARIPAWIAPGTRIQPSSSRTATESEDVREHRAETGNEIETLVLSDKLSRQPDGVNQAIDVDVLFDTGPNRIEIRLPLRLFHYSAVEPGFIALDAEFVGKLAAARRKQADYDPDTGEFIPVRQGDHFFRAYAATINGLEPLVEFIRQYGARTGNKALAEPVSHLTEVHNIRRLANYMRELYLLIVLVAAVAGVLAIFASVYAGVERKRRDLAYLQLMGMGQFTLYLFPYFKSLFLVAGGLAFTFTAYGFFSYVADLRFAGDVEGASLTHLSPGPITLLVGGILLFSSLASLAAAIRITNIDPGEYIRE
uniref:FtsX-like permease family protein n=1 Tax=Candidatus Kentrum sp. DK TaxID=2126562 RepID=A0A450T797_9GAMM|nr:MAG: FtsX-like permease family protein [Candidatus Kentron sp. DK]